MRYFFNIFSGSFFRTLGRIFAYILFSIIGLIIFYFINISNVQAVTIDYYKQFNGTTKAYFGTCNSINNCPSYGPLNDASINDSDKVLTQFITSNMSFNLSKIYTLQFYSSEGFVKDNYYTVNILVDSYYTNTSIPENHKQVVGTGSSLGSYYYSSDVFVSEQLNVSVNFSFYNETLNNFGNILTYTFKAPLSGNWLILDFKSRGSSSSHQFSFYGYNLINHGSKAPTTEDIQSALSNQFNSVNQNITDMEQSIQNSITNNINMLDNSINSLQDGIENTLNSEDTDVNSSKCGVVCKLKGLLSSITELPGKIWDAISVGFDAVVDGIKSAFQTIIDFFTPGSKEECSTLNNIFNFQDTELNKNLSTTNYGRVNADGTITSGGGVYFRIPDINKYVGKTLSLVFDWTYKLDYGYTAPVELSNKVAICYYNSSSSSSKNCSNFNNVDVTGHGFMTFNVDKTYITSGIDTIEVVFKGNYYTPYIYSNVMIYEGNEEKPFAPFGEETCTEVEKTTFFGFFSNFFENIGNFFKRLFDDDTSDAENQAGSFFNDFNDEDFGGITGVVASPLSAVNKITQPCSNISINLWDKNVNLPCGDTLFWNREDVSSFRNIWNILVGGPIIYFLMVKLFKVIEGLKNPDDSRIEVAKL